MYRVKVLGAGSIGNHLANASRVMGWPVDIVDTDPKALDRTKNEIYPTRYGSWDEEIGLFLAEEAPKGCYDLIFIGTPPDSHIELALGAVAEKPAAILIEKPVCAPDLLGANDLFVRAKEAGVTCFVGYDHVVGAARLHLNDVIALDEIGEIETLEVEIREHWGGIFGAHPWLDGPKDSYLGYWKRGGGACAEHSHGLNLWQHISLQLGAGRVTEVSASLDYVSTNEIEYDKLCLVNLKTESGLVGRVVQDVVTVPPRKWARVQGSQGSIDWYCGYKPGIDAVLVDKKGYPLAERTFPKTRPDDFVMELKHVESVLKKSEVSSISVERGLDTMLVIAAAHKSAQEGRAVGVDYNKGYVLGALS